MDNYISFILACSISCEARPAGLSSKPANMMHEVDILFVILEGKFYVCIFVLE
ncbi:hypothetical protein CY34DRAFT_481733 [Suillus luteus UH-Slu-Lm8-n1]|uniref:Uncharacterized protein n=1 Tax=Suillus luteus UH-Slu-Lm8-n1 TaxID=930992 RepID=A0A0D0A723_9AGAM|nr:hypothetical protein CY34DRAFT_481733 [Suillus luteus UH-Slu-Lm8-n1]